MRIKSALCTGVLSWHFSLRSNSCTKSWALWDFLLELHVLRALTSSPITDAAGNYQRKKNGDLGYVCVWRNDVLAGTIDMGLYLWGHWIQKPGARVFFQTSMAWPYDTREAELRSISQHQIASHGNDGKSSGYNWSSSKKNIQARCLEIVHKSTFYSCKAI